MKNSIEITFIIGKYNQIFMRYKSLVFGVICINMQK